MEIGSSIWKYIIIYGLCHLTDIVLSLVQPQFVSNYIYNIYITLHRMMQIEIN